MDLDLWTCRIWIMDWIWIVILIYPAHVMTIHITLSVIEQGDP